MLPRIRTAILALLATMYAVVTGRRFAHLPVAPGRIVAIVPAHEEHPDDLRACIWSILNQRNVLVEEVHVVDDGSMRYPVQPFSHPRVRWHRKEHGGKRSAQVYVLDRLDPDDWDFILTVDVDSVLHEDAMEHQLRAFSRPQVTATTGMVMVRDAQMSRLSRIGTSGLWTAPGAMAAYRARILFQNRRRYLSAGPCADDRWLAMYAALEGEVVGVREAVVWSGMPTYRQRLRWSMSWWCTIPFAFANQMFARLAGLVQLAGLPLFFGYAVSTLPVHASSLFGVLYLLVRYAVTGRYLVARPGMSRRTKLWTWLLLTPVESIHQLFYLGPIKYIALFKLRNHARGDAVGCVPGSVYYSGYLDAKPADRLPQMVGMNS